LIFQAPDVVPVLLEYLSALESTDLVYLQQHTDKMKDVTNEQLEEIRLRMANSGPLAEAMNMCLERCYVSKEGKYVGIRSPFKGTTFFLSVFR
jgi:nitrate reductase assembly molybdenum cofactor insertion protein NarJ